MSKNILIGVFGFIVGVTLVISLTYDKPPIVKTLYKPIYIDQWGNAYDFVKEIPN